MVQVRQRASAAKGQRSFITHRFFSVPLLKTPVYVLHKRAKYFLLSGPKAAIGSWLLKHHQTADYSSSRESYLFNLSIQLTAIHHTEKAELLSLHIPIIQRAGLPQHPCKRQQQQQHSSRTVHMCRHRHTFVLQRSITLALTSPPPPHFSSSIFLSPEGSWGQNN